MIFMFQLIPSLGRRLRDGANNQTLHAVAAVSVLSDHVIRLLSGGLFVLTAASLL